MNIDEYSALMGYDSRCSEEEFQMAEWLYMNAGDMDKAAFCADYRKHRGSAIIEALAEKASHREDAIETRKRRDRDIARALLKEAEDVRKCRLIETSENMGRLAVEMIGSGECIRWKISQGYELNKADLEYIADNLE